MIKFLILGVLSFLTLIFFIGLTNNEPHFFEEVNPLDLYEIEVTDPSFAMDVVTSSTAGVSYESPYRLGIINQLPIDVERLFPILKGKYSGNSLVLWAYELKIMSFSQEGEVFEVNGEIGKKNFIYFTIIDLSSISKVSKLRSAEVKK